MNNIKKINKYENINKNICYFYKNKNVKYVLYIEIKI